ncbi:hypothetical protein U1Q18_037899, partial [Sarracenia purpurea var. burkii]
MEGDCWKGDPSVAVAVFKSFFWLITVDFGWAFGLHRSSRSDLKEDKSHVSVGFQPSDQTFRSARPASQQSSRAPAQADAQLCRPAPADLTEQPCHPIRPRHPVRYCDKQSNLGSVVPSCGTAPHLSPASLASLHIKAIEGS